MQRAAPRARRLSGGVAFVAPGSTAGGLVAFTVKLNSVAAPMRKLLTYDQGEEMARHADLVRATGVRVYFCDPHSQPVATQLIM